MSWDDFADQPDNVISFQDAAVLAGYMRASWDKPERIEAQRAEIEAWAAENGFQIVGFVDNDTKGDKPVEQREPLLKAIVAIERGELGGLVIASNPIDPDDYDRLGRNVEVQEEVLERIWDMGGRFYTTAAGEIPPNYGNLERQIRRRRAIRRKEEELDIIRARRQWGRDRKKARQGYIGGPRLHRPYGLELVQDFPTPGRMDYRPIAHEQAVIRKMCADHQNGVSYSEIARRLNAANEPTVTGARWGHQAVSVIIRRGPVGVTSVPSARHATRRGTVLRSIEARSA